MPGDMPFVVTIAHASRLHIIVVSCSGDTFFMTLMCMLHEVICLPSTLDSREYRAQIILGIYLDWILKYTGKQGINFSYMYIMNRIYKILRFRIKEATANYYMRQLCLSMH